MDNVRLVCPGQVGECSFDSSALGTMRCEGVLQLNWRV